MRSRVERKVITNRQTQMAAHRLIVTCQPCAESPRPNFATRGSVNPPTISCAIIAATKRKEERLVRSFTSAVITPVIAEYGVLLAEYNVISATLVMQAYAIRPVGESPGTEYAATIAIAQGIAVQS